MKIYTSYFYKLRFFKPYHIPISSAIWDPKWYHDNQSQDHKFLNKNGVVNGLRYEPLHPGPQHGNEDDCHGRAGCKYNPKTCRFIREYKQQIFSLDKSKVLEDFQKLCDYFKTKLNLAREPEIIIMVHEDPTNPCSERGVLQEFFECSEWNEEREHE